MFEAHNPNQNKSVLIRNNIAVIGAVAGLAVSGCGATSQYKGAGLNLSTASNHIQNRNKQNAEAYQETAAEVSSLGGLIVNSDLINYKTISRERISHLSLNFVADTISNEVKANNKETNMPGTKVEYIGDNIVAIDSTINVAGDTSGYDLTVYVPETEEGRFNLQDILGINALSNNDGGRNQVEDVYLGIAGSSQQLDPVDEAYAEDDSHDFSLNPILDKDSQLTAPLVNNFSIKILRLIINAAARQPVKTG
jgi:hypothetical protein